MPVYSPYRETRRVVLTDAAQSITNATASDVTWGTEVTDPRGWTSGASATLTCPTGDEGGYSVSYVGGWATNPTITNFVSVQINGVATYSASVNVNLNEVTCSFDRTFAAGDTLKFVVYQASGAAINITSRLELSWLGP